MKKTTPFRPLTLIAATTLAVAAAFPFAALAQNYGAMVQQSMDRMNQIIANGQQHVNGMVQQRMQDPQVRAAYEQHVVQMRSRGQPAMDYPTFTYNYIYTLGGSRAGIAMARANEANIQAKERAAVRGLHEATAQRGIVQQQQRDHYFANQQEAGRGLMGQSTFHAQNGTQTVLPHTWQANTRHEYQGNSYQVNESGQYYVRGSDGWWYPVNR